MAMPLSTISMIFSETAWPIKVKTVCGAFLGRGNEICINRPGHMTKMAALAINSKNHYFFLLQNQKAYDFVTWHEASNNIKRTTKIGKIKLHVGRPCI